KYAFLDNAAKALKQVREIILATDRDGPGINLLNDLAIRLGKPRCRWVSYPEGCKDLNDVLKAHGPDRVRQVLSEARWMAVPGVYRMSELPPISRPKAYEIGIPVLDKPYRVRLGDFCVVTGIPGCG